MAMSAEGASFSYLSYRRQAKRRYSPLTYFRSIMTAASAYARADS
jgi:hypothetical protein